MQNSMICIYIVERCSRIVLGEFEAVHRILKTLVSQFCSMCYLTDKSFP